MNTGSARPNVLFISVDQWPGRLFGHRGHPTVETPTIDQLARNGILYPRAYSECPICIPARRTMMTGTAPRTHGDRVFEPALRMPDRPTLAGTFTDAGYQSAAIGKLHVYPQRDRIGFEEALIAEEGRPQLGTVDDYDLYLADRGYPGRQFMHGMSNNDYGWRTWHLPEDCHVTNWSTFAMCRTIKRRDPTRPAFWHLSYTQPHPPIVPLAAYFERYARREIPAALTAPWAENVPYALASARGFWEQLPPERLADVRRAFYALCTHIDAQLRLVIGTLREENILDDTIILFCSDHGDMLGDYGLYAKRLMYEGSANVPMILVPAARDSARAGTVDPRLVGLQDIMPTLLAMAGIDVPAGCEGLSMVGDARRETLYCEALDGPKATRMIHDGRHKLIWYPAGNVVQLFDLETDPTERDDRAGDPAYAAIEADLTARLIAELYGEDEAHHDGSRLVGTPAPDFTPSPNRGLSGQRGLHYPQPPLDDPSNVVGAS
ncbi:sulfatase-like hydrolase/transferase [Acuticoccus sp. M5D2P5]|uniref:sulfatase-like hydrolase/transferase n=1 Tax=Acuticoccus kalidii TaxID=2910977 RepID=UPI001F1D5FCB|nr:sulfatase-like hydrolase/transferase [Acuticoccus kalidii]MCF3936677.1 sulfatase-like hydrolase/transferase [Acuticoccus kalidii]